MENIALPGQRLLLGLFIDDGYFKYEQIVADWVSLKTN